MCAPVAAVGAVIPIAPVSLLNTEDTKDRIMFGRGGADATKDATTERSLIWCASNGFPLPLPRAAAVAENSWKIQETRRRVHLHNSLPFIRQSTWCAAVYYDAGYWSRVGLNMAKCMYCI